MVEREALFRRRRYGNPRRLDRVVAPHNGVVGRAHERHVRDRDDATARISPGATERAELLQVRDFGAGLFVELAPGGGFEILTLIAVVSHPDEAAGERPHPAMRGLPAANEQEA